MFMKRNVKKLAVIGAVAMAFQAPVQACTALLYTDMDGAHYVGRTLELTAELPYKVAYKPVGTNFSSVADKHAALTFTSKYDFTAITVPDPVNDDLKVLDGMNSQGLAFSLLAYPSADGPANNASKTQAVLAAIDLGSWTLGQYATVAEVKEALSKQPVLVTSLLPLDTLKSPFHYILHDRSGASIVIEYSNGEQHIYDNPVGVMTNGPSFPWHLTNLDNYGFLSNVDHSSGSFNGYKVTQPDSGIATAGLPASNTSVGRFVRATYYSQYAEKAKTPDKAILTLAQVMNNFDRPRGITVDSRFDGGMANLLSPEVNGHPGYISEYTSWITLRDVQRGLYYIRTYDNLGYVKLDLAELAKTNTAQAIELKNLAAQAQAVSGVF